LGHSPVLTIWAFGTPPLGRDLEPSIGLSIDDVFFGRSTYINDANVDLERLEVLRGRQGHHVWKEYHSRRV
jgi:iron complex outermembrane receptor protein